MGYPRHGRKTDHNQAEVVETLRAIPGCTVEIIGEPVDLLVGYRYTNFIFELKNPNAPNPRRTEKQKKFFKEWTGIVHEVWGVHEIITIITGQVP